MVEISDRDNLYVKTLRQFEKAVAGQGSPLASGLDGFASMQAALAALKSAKEKRTVSLMEADLA